MSKLVIAMILGVSGSQLFAQTTTAESQSSMFVLLQACGSAIVGNVSPTPQKSDTPVPRLSAFRFPSKGGSVSRYYIMTPKAGAGPVLRLFNGGDSNNLTVCKYPLNSDANRRYELGDTQCPNSVKGVVQMNMINGQPKLKSYSGKGFDRNLVGEAEVASYRDDLLVAVTADLENVEKFQYGHGQSTPTSSQMSAEQIADAKVSITEKCTRLKERLASLPAGDDQGGTSNGATGG